MHFGALLHDIGKIMVDPAILKAEGGLTEDERRAHPAAPGLGLELLKPITLWEEILPIIHAHHERWDGKGYPRGLAGEEIPLGARVVAVADAFDAMTRAQPHGAAADARGGARRSSRRSRARSSTPGSCGCSWPSTASTRTRSAAT